MKNPMRKTALATTALGMMLAVPGIAAAQETCIQVLGAISTDAQGAVADGQANALIVTTGSAAEGATCIESLDDLSAMLGDGEALTERLAAVEPAASADPDAATVPDGSSPDAVEAQPSTDEEVMPESEDQEAAEADVQAPVEDEVTAEADADIQAPVEDEVTAEADADVQAPVEDEMTADAGAASEQPIGNAQEMLAGLTAGEIVGMDVLSPEGDDIGTVEAVAIDTEGHVNLVMSLDDGVLGLGDSERVVSIEQFDYSLEEEDVVLLQLSEEWLETLPEYDSDTPGYIEIDSQAYVFGG